MDARRLESAGLVVCVCSSFVSGLRVLGIGLGPKSKLLLGVPAVLLACVDRLTVCLFCVPFWVSCPALLRFCSLYHHASVYLAHSCNITFERFEMHRSRFAVSHGTVKAKAVQRPTTELAKLNLEGILGAHIRARRFLQAAAF